MSRVAWQRCSRGSLVGALVLVGIGCSEPTAPGEVFVTQQAIGNYNFTDHVAWSQNPPGGLTPSQVPQFVQLGFDDNFYSGLNTTPPSGMTWATNFTRNLRNPAGNGNAATFDNTLVRVSFYSNTTYITNEGFVEDPVLLKRSWRTAITDGHEQGNHTHRHLDGGSFTVAQWDDEIRTCNDWLTRAFVPNEPAFSVGSGPGATLAQIEGFRSPFLSYNPNAMTAMKAIGFTYDISVEEGWQLSDDCTNFNWPFTLDNGSPGGTAVGRPTGNQSGLWELGAAPFCMPPALRSQVGLSKVTGLDYNMFVSANFTKAQALDTLKYSLDQRLANNRAPLFVGAHTHLYTDNVSLPNTTAQQRREVIEEFVAYALTKPQVRIVTGKNVINWMRNPTALGGVCTPESNATFCSRLGKNCGTVSGNDNCGAARTVTSCGTCTTPQTCGGGGTPNVCGNSANPDRTEGGTATGTGTPCNATTETVAKAYDNLMTAANFTKWCVTSAPSTTTPISTVYDFSGTTAFAITSYTITTGNDGPTRDPRNWTFQGCQGTCTAGSDTGWVTLNTQTNQFAGAARFQTNTYSFTNTTAFQQYRLRVTANNGDTTRFQISELQEFGNAGTCTPESNTAFCSRLGKNCGTVTAADNCGVSRTVTSCGTCTAPQTCGGGGTANVCGGGSCVPESNAAFCSRLLKNCGTVTAPDNCGASRTVTSCGTCTAPQTCGGGGTANVCGMAGGGNCNAPAWSGSATYSNGSIVTANCTATFLQCSSAEVGHSFAWQCVGADPNWCHQFAPGGNDNYNGIWNQLTPACN
jgi:Polysaccharide deacetylase